MQWYFCLSWEATLVQSIGRVRVRKLYWQGATTVLPICACYLAHLSPDFCSKYGCTRITTVGQSPATMVQNGLQQSLCIAEKWSSEVVPVFPKRSRFELGKIRFFSLLIWRFMASGILLQFDTSHHAVGSFACLGSHPSLANSHGRECWSCKNKVPNIFFHGVHVIWPIWAEIFMAVQI